VYKSGQVIALPATTLQFQMFLNLI